MTLGESIWKVALKKGFSTQDELAKACGLSRSFVTRILGDERPNLTGEAIVKLSHGLGVPMDFFAPFVAPGVSVPPPPVADSVPEYPIDVIGYVAAGPGIDEPIIDERIFVEAKYRHCHAYRVRGNSMEADKLFDGDTIIVCATPSPEVGDTVVVWLESTQGCVVKEFGKNNTLRCGSPVVVYSLVPGDRILGRLMKSERLYDNVKKKKGKR